MEETLDNVTPTTDNVTPDVESSDTLLGKATTTAPEATETAPEATTAPETTPSPSFGMDAFLELMDDDLKGKETWKSFNNPADVAKSYVELQKLVGWKGEIPAKDDLPEAWDEFYTKLGKPESAEAYGIELPDNLKAMEGSDERANKVAEIAHKANLTTDQANELFNGLFEMESAQIGQSIQQAEAKEKANLETLQSAWGDGIQDMCDAVSQMEKKLGVFDTMEANGLNNNAEFLVLMGRIAGEMSESSTIETAMSQTPAGLENEHSEIMTQIKDIVRSGGKVPAHLYARRDDLANKMYK